MGACGGSSTKPSTSTRGNVPTWGTTIDDFPPDADYMAFLGLCLSSAADSDRGVRANSAHASEAATRNVGSGLIGDWQADDLFKFLIGKDGGSSIIRAENNGVDNNGDAGATNGCGLSIDSGGDDMAKGEGPAIVIDLGMTYSCVGVWQHDRVDIIANDQGNQTTPPMLLSLAPSG
ncbi:unnamed protein product [Linum trigynum]|uniref:Uncharacterized protein n=1 Tax=Linum trigynum TaxID=586398 RepID=A0AAV2FS42_9ROSI